MPNLCLYRSYTIEERKKSETKSEKENLNLAINFWNNITNTEKPQDIEHMLKDMYKIDLDDLSCIFDTDKYNSDFLNHESWTQFLSNFILKPNKVNDNLFTSLNNYPFFMFFKPFLIGFVSEFNSFSERNSIKLTDTALQEILLHLYQLLFNIAHKTLILEINTLRLKGELVGATSQERYNYYHTYILNDKEYLFSLINEYPVLFRLLITKVLNTKNFLKELLMRVQKDKYEIKSLFDVDIPIKEIHHINLGSGDSHNNGKTVCVITFSEGRRLVYKPRSLELDEKFQNFLKWYNDKNDTSTKLVPFRLINKKDYGWVEFIENSKCINNDEVCAFYHRLGQLLAIVHIFNATDFHYENIIASGEYPFLIDLESLFHHTIMPDHHDSQSPVINKALRIVRDSVVSTGVLPSTANINLNKKTIFDLSGISDADNQITPFKEGFVKKINSDEIRIEKETFKIKGGSNLPRLEGKDIFILDYLPNFSEGFECAYTFFYNNKKGLIEILDGFSNVEVRKIFRDTMKYNKLLNMSYHPDFLRNQIDREILLSRLWVESKNEESIKKIVPYEIRDLVEGDIPYFSSSPGSYNIVTSDGTKHIPLYYKSGMDLCKEKIGKLNKEDCLYQLEIIHSTISAVYSKTDLNLVALNNNDDQDPNDLIFKVKVIGDLIIEKAIKTGEGMELEYCWTSMVLDGNDETNWKYSITGPGLYDGNTGIALFFCYLWKITGDEKYKKAAVATITPVRKLMTELNNRDDISIGAFIGIGGILYTLHHLGEVLDNPVFIEEALAYSKKLPKSIKNDQLYDVIGGSAGLLHVIINLYEHTHQEFLLEIAKMLADHLVESAEPIKNGVAWLQPFKKSDEAYIGFSHGNAGIISALARFNKYGNNNEIVECIKKGLTYENFYYNPDKKNWFSKHLDSYPIAWCHGAPGILLSRAMLLRENIHEVCGDIKNSLDFLSEEIGGDNYSLCHGQLGNLDILLYVRKLLPEYFVEYDSIINDVYQKICLEKNFKADLNTVGIMNGISSIGYGLLRLINSDSIPSVLALEPPR
ncbi:MULTISPECIES: type 2 lanthipeptide synthetase LanM family protein [unclassified Lysinibacillus]|uniref:type 2 lanthipeptide synthetase LanM family protein n=1 Tax=unclassified Lysinibacillus TaxID=2636778 RepID=UPI0020119EEC|nr:MULTISPECIES: type 2 lanthipeptide synthetase LanM family protein [unclassified Lysinibacillus]MCL1695624.1 type 2 lanthipeptide synthetase LanM family protein [Lysinibacillus sp. BPa_S21]MCL1700131.1 type 2 lanthipeptide synthetase LanM family protein [Lysinibacillus sp. Bpr_S20]